MQPATRDELAGYFTGVGVELGVAGGAYSEAILRNGEVTLHYAIDRWSDHHGIAEYKAAVDRLGEWDNCRVLRMTFAEAAPLFADASLSYIYIDGYAHTGQDGGQAFAQWWLKLMPGGILAGHDYHPDWPLTVQAVDAFARLHGLTISTTREYEPGKKWPSWWLLKGR